MKKIISKMTLGGVVAVVFLFSACSDGILPPAPPPPIPPLPEVTKVEIVNPASPSQSLSLDASACVTEEEEPAEEAAAGKEASEQPKCEKEMEVDSGASFDITVKMSNVKSVAVTSIPEDILGKEGVVLEVDATTGTVDGKVTVSSLTKNAVFTIKATNVTEKDGQSSTSELNIEITVTIRPVPEALTINKFTAEPVEIKEGETSNVCWDVTPLDSNVSIKDQDGKDIYEYVELPVIDDEMPESEPSEPVSADKELAANSEKCVTVRLQKTTDFTLTAKTANEQEATSKVSIKVNPIEVKVVSFTANGMESTVLDKAGTVELVWAVEPANAIVTIDNNVGTVEAVGKKTVTVERTTIFTITASYKDKTPAVRQAVVNVMSGQGGGGGGQVVGAAVTLSANATDVFAGEEVKFSWAIEGVASDQEAVLALVGPEGTTKISGFTGEVAVKPLVSGAYTAEISISNSVVKSNSVNVSVRKWSSNKSNVSADGINIINNGQLILFGSHGDGAKIGRLTNSGTWEDVNIKLEVGDKDSGFGVFSLYNGTFTGDLANMGSFSLSAFASDTNKDGGSRVYGGGTGFIVYSKNAGKTWTGLDVFPITKKGKKEIPTCNGETQSSKAASYDTLQNLHQVCDLYVDSSDGVDRLIAATDFNIFYLDDVDKRINDPGSNDWKRATGLENIVVNTLESYGGKIFAGTAKGLYASDSRGESWTSANGGDVGDGTAIYAIAVAADGKALYVGGPDGVFTAQLGTSDFAKAGDVGGKVYSLAVDTTNGNVYAGTDAGVAVSRDSGKTWVNVTESMGAAPTVYSLAIAKRTGEVAIYAATSGGVYSSVAPAYVNTTVTPEPEPEPSPEPETPAPSATDALKMLAK